MMNDRIRKVIMSFVTLVLFLFGTNVFAQQHIKGKVIDSQSKEALPGVNILVVGSSNGTATSGKGTYELNVASLQDTLRFSYIGYTSKLIPINGRTTINVALTPKTINAKQLVVIGYGTQTKAELTGSVATTQGSDLQKIPVANVSNALEGQMPGVIVNTRSGEPGSASSNIMIRGEGTLNNNSPLVVIDGVPSTMNNFDRLNPADIKSVSVLKDASAAIYGAEAANGVILVTTREGKSGAPKITYNGSFGYNQPTRIPNFVNGWQFMTWQNEKDKAYGRSPEYSQTLIDKLKNGTYNPRQYSNTDWEHALIKSYSPMTTHQLQVSGGDKHVTYFLSGQYLYQDGIYRNSATYYHQGNLRANVNVNLTKNFKISLKSSGRVQYKHYPNASAATIFTQAMAEYPFLPVYYPNGDPSGSQALVNPVLMAQGKTGYNKQKYYIMNGILSFNLKLPEITKGLYIHGLASDEVDNWDHLIFNDSFDMYTYDPTTNTYQNQRTQETGGNGLGNPMSMSQGFDKSIQTNYTLRMGYKHDFGPHHVSAFVAYEQTSFNHNWMTAYRQGLLSDQIVQLFAGADQQKNNNGGSDHVGRDGLIHGGKQDYFGRVTYNYKQKYLADFTLRHDGSFRFPANHRWGTFPAISVGWRISQEPFFKNHIHFISALKLKASWGRMGNDQIAPYQYENLYNFGSGYVFGTTPDHYRGFVTGVAPNPNITWEVAVKKDIGFDAQLLNGLLSVDADYFFSNRSNILVAPNASVPNYTGLTLPDENIGKVNNHGIDGSVTLQNNSKGFNYKLSGNITFARNKVVYMSESKNIPAWQRVEGHPMNSWLVYKANGIYKNQQEINNSPHLPGTQPGDTRYIDVNGDGQITPDDMVRIYESAIPEIQYGVNMTGGYKGIQLYVLWQGQARAKQMILPGAQNKQLVPPTWLYNNRWTPSNPNAKFPHAFDRESSINNRPSTLWLRNAWFLRLKTVRLSYSLPKRLTSMFSLDRLQLYVSGQNLFVISAIKNYDPELNNSLGQYYPQVRVFNVGVSLSL